MHYLQLMALQAQANHSQMAAVAISNLHTEKDSKENEVRELLELADESVTQIVAGANHMSGNQSKAGETETKWYGPKAMHTTVSALVMSTGNQISIATCFNAHASNYAEVLTVLTQHPGSELYLNFPLRSLLDTLINNSQVERHAVANEEYVVDRRTKETFTRIKEDLQYLLNRIERVTFV